jgi:tRNA G18 (ribose-2'-O)-methylase SpoU
LSKGKTQRSKLEFLRQRHQAAKAEPGRHEFILVLDHLKPDFNIGKIYRSAETFGAKEICLVGIEWFDPGPSMGSFKKVPSRYFEDFEACKKALLAEGYQIFALAPGEGAALGQQALPVKTALVLGNEGVGLSFAAQSTEGVSALRIAQYGQSQSLNVSVAASIAAFEYVRQHGKPEHETKPQPNELRGQSEEED